MHDELYVNLLTSGLKSSLLEIKVPFRFLINENMQKANQNKPPNPS